jgi:hypothetical protein
MVGTIGTVASNQLTQEYTRILSQSNVALSGVRPSYINQLKQDTLIKSLKQDGSWNFIDVLYILANDDATGNFALLNWANPSLYSLTRVNSPTFISNRGYVGGTFILLSSSWAPSNGVNFQQNSASFGGMIYNTPDTAGSALIGTNGTAGTSNVYMVPRTTSTYRTTLNNTALNGFLTPQTPQNPMARRVLGAFRSQSTNYDQFYPSSSTVDGINIATATSTTRVTQQVNILSALQNGTRLFGGTNTASMAWFGGYEIRNRLTTFTSSMTTYINSI